MNAKAGTAGVEAKARGGRSGNWLGDTVLLAMLTGLLYVIPFAYEAGYCRYFGIPLDWVQLSVTDRIKGGLGVAIVVLVLLPAVDGLFSLVPAFRQPALVSAARAAMLFLGGALPFLLLGASSTAWTALVGGVTVLFLAAVFNRADGQGRWRLFPVLLAVRRQVGSRVFWGAAWMLLAVGVSFVWGARHAERRVGFFVLDGHPDRVVLTTYGDRAICAPFDAGSHTFTARYSIVKLGEPTTPDLVLASVGPLRPVMQANAPMTAPTSKPSAASGLTPRPSLLRNG